MSKKPTNIVLEHLKKIQMDLAAVKEGQDTLIQRIGSLEIQVSGLRNDVTRVDHRLDGLDRRLDRIEKRLALVDA